MKGRTMSNARFALLALALTTPVFGLGWNYPDSSTCPDDGSGVCTASIGPITVPAGSGANFGFITPVFQNPHCGYNMSISVDQPDLEPPGGNFTALIDGTTSWSTWDSYPLSEDSEVVTMMNNDTEADIDATVTFTLTYIVPDGLACPPQ